MIWSSKGRSMSDLFIMYKEAMFMTALVDLVLNGIVFCKKGMVVQLKNKTGKYSILSRTYQDGEEQKTIEFKVSNELMPFYFE